MNSDFRDTAQPEEFQHCSWKGRLCFLLGIVNFRMFHAFATLRRFEYLQGFLWILHGKLFKGDFGNWGFLSNVSFSLKTFVKTLNYGIWNILRIQEAVQNGNFRNFKFIDISLFRDFLMQYWVSGFLCPFYACYKALEPFFIFCSQIIFFVHCWKIATNIFMPFSFHVDHFYIFHAKFLSTGLARRFEGLNNTLFVFYLLCFIFDVLIPGLLKMNRHPMLYSYNVIIMKVLLKSEENKYGNNILVIPRCLLIR